MAKLDGLTSLAAGRQEYACILTVTFCFGVYAVLAGISLHFLFKRIPINSIWGRNQCVLVGYTAFMLLLTMAWYYCVARNLEFLLVEQPKAPSETTQRFWMSRNYVQNVLATCQFLGSDALILFRAYIICGRRWPFIALSLAIYISFLGVGITINLVPLSTQFGGTLPLPPVHALATAFYVLSAALNLITTAIITFTLLQQDGRGHKYGVSGNSITTVTILAESAAFSAMCAVVFVVLFQVGSPMQSWFGALNNCSAFLSQGWIILRVSLGSSYKRNVVFTSRAEFTTDIHMPSRSETLSHRTHSADVGYGGREDASTTTEWTAEDEDGRKDRMREVI